MVPDNRTLPRRRTDKHRWVDELSCEGTDGRPQPLTQSGPAALEPAGGDVAAGRRIADSLALSIHGPAGVLDVIVPPEAAANEVAREYAEQSRLTPVPTLHTHLGVPLEPDVSLADAGVGTGSILVASLDGAVRPGARGSLATARATVGLGGSPGPLSVLWFSVAAAVAALAGYFAARTSDSTMRTVAIDLLVAAAVVGILPIGRFAGHRVLAAPAFAAAAAFAVAWSPGADRLPTVLGVSALVAAVTAAIARALDRRVEEALRVWIVVGVGFFLVTGAGALIGFSPQVVWSILLLAAMLGARFAPGFAVDVPDQFLIDLERLAVTAWSARERPAGGRGRTVVPQRAVAAVAARGTRIVTAACVAILVIVAVSAPLLIDTATRPLDRIGARCLVGLVGAALLLAARSYRHPPARALLRAAGLTCWLVLLIALLSSLGTGRVTVVALTAIMLAALLVVVAVATGRGWRSAWWSRRAEVAESLCGSLAVASVFMAVGLFRSLWELTS